MVTDFSEENLLANVGDADAIAVRTAMITKRVLDAAPRLKVISRHGVGYDNIPVSECTARGIAVLVGAVNAISVAEHTWYLILAAARSGVELDAATRRGDFGVRERVTGVELNGRNLLIIGFGRIGKRVADRARAFGMDILVFDPYLHGDVPKDVRVFASLESGLREADVVTLHAPLTDETRRVRRARTFATAKRRDRHQPKPRRPNPPGCVVSRREVGTPSWLRSGHIRGRATSVGVAIGF